MWKPSSVVPQHRTRAILVWVAILIAAFAYTVWQTTVVIRKRQNPSTKLLVSNQRYQFPVVTVCLDDGFGCGYSDGSIDKCVASAVWNSVAWYRDFELLSFPTQGQEENCVEFDLTQYYIPEGEREAAANVTATISMDWISSDNAAAETDYSAGVFVYLSDSSSGGRGEEESLLVPYSRNEVASTDRNFELTALTIGKTSRKYLSGASITNYPVLTISTTRVVVTKSLYEVFPVSSTTSTSEYSSYTFPSSYVATQDSAIGSLYLEITQGSFSNTEVEDIEPLEIGALFGNVGGFWELLVLAWGVFFITKSRDGQPTLKARNFAKVLQRGDKKRKRRKIDSVAAEEAGQDGPRPPDWDSISDDDARFADARDSGVNEKGERSRRLSAQRSARSRRPVAHPPPRRVSSYSRSGSLGTSATTNDALTLSRRSSASMGPVARPPPRRVSSYSESGRLGTSTTANDTLTLSRRSSASMGPVARPPPRRVSSYSESGSLGTSTTTNDTLTLSRRSSASMADGTGLGIPITLTTRRWSGSGMASPASKFNTYDAAMAQTRRAKFTVAGSRNSSFSNNPDPTGGDHGKARTSFFPTPHVGGSRIHHHDDSEDGSSQSASSPARGANSFEEADDDDLELGYGGQLGRRHCEA